MDNGKAIEELLSFLGDHSLEARRLAAERVAALTVNDETMQILKKTSTVKSLCPLVGDRDPVLARFVLSALVNLSGDETFVQEMIMNDLVKRVVNGALDKSNQPLDLFGMLLSNLTRLEEGCRRFLQVAEVLEGLQCIKLLELFLKPIPDGQKDEYGWIAGILCNVTQIREGRKLFLDQTKKLLPRIFPFIQHSNKVRQRGALGVIRNCLFQSASHPYVLGSEIELLPKLLWPLVVPGNFNEEEMNRLPLQLRTIPSDKVMEADVESRTMILDCFQLLCSTKFGRDALRQNEAYLVLREYDKIEVNQENCTCVSELVMLLEIMDEPKTEVNVDPLEHVGAASASASARVEEVYSDDETTPEPKKAVLRDEDGEAVEEI